MGDKENILEEAVRDCDVLALFPGGMTKILEKFSKSLFVLFDLAGAPERPFDVTFIGEVKSYDTLMRVFKQIDTRFFIVSFCYHPEVSKAIDHSRLVLVSRLGVGCGTNLYKGGRGLCLAQ